MSRNVFAAAYDDVWSSVAWGYGNAARMFWKWVHPWLDTRTQVVDRDIPN
jgi:hypothetical protein